jgi:hypothetical protein
MQNQQQKYFTLKEAICLIADWVRENLNGSHIEQLKWILHHVDDRGYSDFTEADIDSLESESAFFELLGFEYDSDFETTGQSLSEFLIENSDTAIHLLSILTGTEVKRGWGVSKASEIKEGFLNEEYTTADRFYNENEEHTVLMKGSGSSFGSLWMDDELYFVTPYEKVVIDFKISTKY